MSLLNTSSLGVVAIWTCSSVIALNLVIPAATLVLKVAAARISSAEPVVGIGIMPGLLRSVLPCVRVSGGAMPAAVVGSAAALAFSSARTRRLSSCTEWWTSSTSLRVGRPAGSTMLSIISRSASRKVMPWRNSSPWAARNGSERCVSSRVWLAISSHSLSASFGWFGAWPARDSFWYSLAKRWLASCQAPAATAS